MEIGAYWKRAAEDAQRIIDRIAATLGTAEQGDALVEVARNAHRAEQELATMIREVEKP